MSGQYQQGRQPPIARPNQNEQQPGAHMQNPHMVPAMQQPQVPGLHLQQHMVPAQGAVSMMPAQGPTAMVQAQGNFKMVPAQGSVSMVPAQGAAAQPSMVPSQSMVPGQSMIPAQGTQQRMMPAMSGGGLQQQQQQRPQGTAGPSGQGVPSTSQQQQQDLGNRPGGPMQQQGQAAQLQAMQQLMKASMLLEKQRQQRMAAGGVQFGVNLTANAAGVGATRVGGQPGTMGMGQFPRPNGSGMPGPPPGFGLPRTMMMPPPKRRYPADDERKVLPRRGLDFAVKAAGLETKFKLDPAAEAVLDELYEEVISNAISFGCNNAKRRQSATLRPRDMAVYLERTWNLYVPGFGSDQLRPYRRAVASELHRARTRAARQMAAEVAVVEPDSKEGAHAAGAGGAKAT